MRPSDDMDSELAGEDESFLADSKSSPSRPVHFQNARHLWQSSWVRFSILQLFLLGLYTATFVALIDEPGRHLIHSPALSAVEYQKTRFNGSLVIDSPFYGPPSDEIDRAWGDLLNNMNIAVPKSDLERIGTRSIPIPGRKGMYFAGLSVFHELHCIKRLRQYTYKDHYFPNSTDELERLNRLHTDHCLEIMRQATLCRADVSLFSLQWSRDIRQPRADFSQEHKCVNFELVNAWAGERRVDPSKPGVLVHPVFGDAYREGESSRIGGSEDKSPTIFADDE